MPNYLEHPTKTKTPNRKTRKGARNVVFITNKLAFRKLRFEREALRLQLDETEQTESL